MIQRIPYYSSAIVSNRDEVRAITPITEVVMNPDAPRVNVYEHTSKANDNRAQKASSNYEGYNPYFAAHFLNDGQTSPNQKGGIIAYSKRKKPPSTLLAVI